MDIVDVYNKCGSIKATAKELGMSEQKTRKLLITAGAYESPTTKKINALVQAGYSREDIAAKCGLTLKNLSNYLPYEKGIYNSDTPTVNALRIRKHRKGE